MTDRHIRHTEDEVQAMDDTERRRWGYPPAGSPADRADVRWAEYMRQAGAPNPVRPRYFGTTTVRLDD